MTGGGVALVGDAPLRIPFMKVAPYLDNGTGGTRGGASPTTVTLTVAQPLFMR